MAFIQTIEFTTTRIDEVRAAVDEYTQATEGKRTTTRAVLTGDRDRSNRYMQIVEFPSYEEAMRNSELPETQTLAEKLTNLCDGPPDFRNLDVIEEHFA